jgi:hypothetical protein
VKHPARLLTAVSVRLRRHGRGWAASLLQLAAVLLVVAFADTFGTRWALLAAAVALVLVSLAVEGDRP